LKNFLKIFLISPLAVNHLKNPMFKIAI